VTRLEFRNRLCILRSIDEDELRTAGIKLSDKDWLSFCLDPFRFFLKMDDETADKLWRVIERRALPIDWNNNTEASAAIAAGKLPDGFSINDAGGLVIPDMLDMKVRGGYVLIANFDEVVTVSGRVVKSRALNSARAS
jgi:hypothetical protein